MKLFTEMKGKKTVCGSATAMSFSFKNEIETSTTEEKCLP
jgi:hypothetical protein